MDVQAPTEVYPPSSLDPITYAFDLQYLIGLENHQFACHLDHFTRSLVASITAFYPMRILVTSEPKWAQTQSSFNDHLRLFSDALIKRAFQPLDLSYLRLHEEDIKKIADGVANELKLRSETLKIFESLDPEKERLLGLARVVRTNPKRSI
jgi:hypothetical protein